MSSTKFGASDEPVSNGPAGWTYVTTTLDGGDVSIHGRDPWTHEWQPSENESIVVPHPSYPDQQHTLAVFTFTSGERFAAGELSNGVWCFYLWSPR